MSIYLPILLMVVLSLLFSAGSFLAAGALGPKRPTAAKTAAYECGIVSTGGSPERFPVRFYLVAMIFIVFDVEVAFLYPFAVASRRLGTFGLIEMGVFLAIVLISYLYLLSSGALEWGAARVTNYLPRPVLRAATVDSATFFLDDDSRDAIAGEAADADSELPGAEPLVAVA